MVFSLRIFFSGANATPSTGVSNVSDMGKRLIGWFAATLFLLFPRTAPGKETAFHLMMIREVFAGTAAAPNAQYVMLQMYAVGQTLVAGHRIFVFDSAGAPVDTFTFAGNVANGFNQATILIATAACTSFFHVPADLVMNAAAIPPRGGKICFDGIDCLSWGNYSGSSVGTGTPFNVCGGLLPGKAARRDISRGIAFQLDPPDDTNNSSVDFKFATPTPRNNAGQTGSAPASTCGNGTLEGLEQCDDNNTDNGDGCSFNCEIEPPFCANARGDLNASGDLTASDAVLMLNCVFIDPTGCDLCYTDVNSDGALTASDAIVELNVVFLGASFPC